MLTNIDSELFPDDCEVVEIPSHNQWVFLIQKNGTTSLRRDAVKYNYKFYRNHEIGSLQYIDVYIRNPKQRYISGINTFLRYTMRDHPGLDPKTCAWMACRYLFLNTHYLPQFLWLMNLKRFIRDDCILRLHDFENFGKIVTVNNRAGIVPADEMLQQQILDDSHNIDFWFFVDQILLDLAGESFVWKDLIGKYRSHPSDCWKILSTRQQHYSRLIDALSQD